MHVRTCVDTRSFFLSWSTTMLMNLPTQRVVSYISRFVKGIEKIQSSNKLTVCRRPLFKIYFHQDDKITNYWRTIKFNYRITFNIAYKNVPAWEPMFAIRVQHAARRNVLRAVEKSKERQRPKAIEAASINRK